MPKPFAFTEAKIKALDPPASGRVYYRDSRLPGLQVCVTSTGRRTYYYVRRLDGKPTRVLLGFASQLSVEAARTAAGAAVGKVAAGQNPQVERRQKREEPTLGVLWEHWLAYAKGHKRSWPEDEAQWKRYLEPWKARRLGSITKRNVLALHAKIGNENGHYAANRMLALLRSMFNKASEIGWENPNPCSKIKAFREESRDRFIRPDEMPRFFEALEAEPSPILRGFFLTCLLTGARRGNVQRMRWEDINLANSLWRIPQTKRGVPQVVPLSPVALQVIISLQPLSVDGWVFPAFRIGKRKHGYLSDPMPAWRRLLNRAGLSDLRIHDLRRSMGSWLALGGVSLQVIGKTLGHTRPETTAIYSRLTLDPVRAAINQATAAMLTAGKQDKLLGIEPEGGEGNG